MVPSLLLIGPFGPRSCEPPPAPPPAWEVPGAGDVGSDEERPARPRTADQWIVRFGQGDELFIESAVSSWRTVAWSSRWDGERWTGSVALPPFRPDLIGGVAFRSESWLEWMEDGELQLFPMPPTPIVGRRVPEGPATMVRGLHGEPWFFQLSGRYLNSWWWDAGWHQLGRLREDGDDDLLGPGPTVVFDDGGHPIVGWMEPRHVRLQRWNGRHWVDLSTAVEENRDGRLRSIGADGPRLVVVTEVEHHRLALRLHDGTSWRELEVPGRRPATLVAAFLPDGRLVAAWDEPMEQRVIVATLQGAGWAPVGSWPYDAYLSALHIDASPDGRRVLSWAARTLGVVAWNGNGFTDLTPSPASPPFEVARPTVQVDERGDPTVTWVDRDHRYAQQWDGTRWTDPLVVFEPESYEVVRPELPEGAPPPWVYKPRGYAVFDRLVAWTELTGVGDRIQVREWTGQRWEPLGSGVAARCGGVCRQVAIAAGGDAVCVAWIEDGVGLDVRCLTATATGPDRSPAAERRPARPCAAAP